MAHDRLVFPLSRCRTLEDYRAYEASSVAAERRLIDEALLAAHAKDTEWTVPGWSILAGQSVDFIVDQLSGGHKQDDQWHPNLRERLVCPVTGLNNRQRLIGSLVMQEAIPGATIWFMEQVTPFFAWARSALKAADVIGSEYLGPTSQPGMIAHGIRHEDCERLSFADGSLDMVVSSDVLEHVPHPDRAFRECARVLAPLGRMITTIPFRIGSNETICRAMVKDDGTIDHLLEPVYHGNPMSPDGSLVFTDFGWDIVQMIKSSGFSDCYVDFFHAPDLGHYGYKLRVLTAIR